VRFPADLPAFQSLTGRLKTYVLQLLKTL